jgi:hypothetical protein
MKNLHFDRESEPGVSSWSGVYTGTLTDWATDAGCTPRDVLDAVNALDVEPLVDTAESKGRTDTERPTAPELRSLAFWRDDAKRLVEEIVGNHRMDN